MNKKAYIIDCHSTGSFHEVINQGYLMMISDLYEKVIYIAEKTSCDNIKRILRECDITLNNVEYIPLNIKKFRFKPESICSFFNAIKVGYLNNSYFKKSSPDSDVFYNNFLHFTALFNLLSFRKYSTKVFYMCHAEMEHIAGAKKRGVFAHIFKYYLKFLFNVVPINARHTFILLSTDMADRFKKYISDKNKNRIKGMDHCYIRPDIKCPTNKVVFEGIKIGIPGALSLERGINSMKIMLQLIVNPYLRFYSISTISDEIIDEHFIMLNKTGQRLPFDLYNSYVKDMDAYLMMYDIGSYKMTASGALLEAIWNEKPVFALRNTYFEYVFKKFGNLGFLADSIEELANKLNNLTKNDMVLYVENIKKAKEALLPCNVKEQLKIIIEHKV